MAGCPDRSSNLTEPPFRNQQINVVGVGRKRDNAGGGGRRRGLIVRWVLALVVLTTLALVALIIRWFVVPSQDDPDQADAVVVFAGGVGTERFDTALALMDRGVAPVLVFNTSTQTWYREPGTPDLCQEPAVDFEVICFAANPNSTRGEAAMFGDIAGEQGWNNVVLVTSPYHLHRAELWLGRCVDASIQKVAGDSPNNLRQVPRELGGTLHALVLDRSCPTHRGTVTGGSASVD